MRSIPMAFGAAFGLAAICCANPSGAATFKVYDSGEFGEKISVLAGDNVTQVLYSVDVGDGVNLQVGDILVIFADAQLVHPNNNTDFYLTSHLMRAATSMDTTGTEIDDANAFNVTVDAWNGTPTKPAVAVVTGSTNRRFVNLLVQAKGSLNVDQNAGRLQVLRIRP